MALTPFQRAERAVSDAIAREIGADKFLRMPVAKRTEIIGQELRKQNIWVTMDDESFQIVEQVHPMFYMVGRIFSRYGLTDRSEMVEQSDAYHEAYTLFCEYRQYTRVEKQSFHRFKEFYHEKTGGKREIVRVGLVYQIIDLGKPFYYQPVCQFLDYFWKFGTNP